ncbi:MAG: hypothetical protein A4E19_19875 [Nitrospira sp. SG-bin1]|nr:MAG: hypothetical protein A4E19_19875 [Nitrospira sp. SG-bin1]
MSITVGYTAVSSAEEHQSNKGQPQNAVQGTAPAFPLSKNCTTNSPCRNVQGEIVKIEESYWITQPNGVQSHIRVVPDTKIQSRVKVGDSVAAQVRSNGEAEAVLKMDPPQVRELPVPDSSLKEMR